MSAFFWGGVFRDMIEKHLKTIVFFLLNFSDVLCYFDVA